MTALASQAVLLILCAAAVVWCWRACSPREDVQRPACDYCGGHGDRYLPRLRVWTCQRCEAACQDAINHHPAGKSRPNRKEAS